MKKIFIMLVLAASSINAFGQNTGYTLKEVVCTITDHNRKDGTVQKVPITEWHRGSDTWYSAESNGYEVEIEYSVRQGDKINKPSTAMRVSVYKAEGNGIPFERIAHLTSQSFQHAKIFVSEKRFLNINCDPK